MPNRGERRAQARAPKFYQAPQGLPKGNCSNCGTVLRLPPNLQLINVRVGTFTITCPSCGMKNNIKGNA
jgi:RNase P subunit RPR2